MVRCKRLEIGFFAPKGHFGSYLHDTNAVIHTFPILS